MSIKRVSTLLLVLVVGFTQPISAEDENSFGEPSPNIPELKELNRFTGNWEGQLINSDLKFPSERKWILNGYVLKHEFNLPGGELRGIIYRGYNKTNNKYTMTFIDSEGNMSMLYGYWNESLKLFTFEAIDNDAPVQKYESDFSTKGTEQWTIVFDSTKMNQLTGIARQVQK